MTMSQFVTAAARAAIVIAGLGVGTALPATELKVVSGDGPQHDGVKAMETWTDNLGKATDGDLTGRVYAQTLVSVKEIPAALRDGLADLGLIVHPYHPAEFPEANFIADFSLFAENNAAAAGAASSSKTSESQL